MAEGIITSATIYTINETVEPGAGRLFAGLGKHLQYPAIIIDIFDKVQIGQYDRFIENELGFSINEMFLNELNFYINNYGELVIWSQRGDTDKFSIDEETGNLIYTE